MSSSAALQNPHAWCYKKMLHDKHVNPMHLSIMTQKYYNKKEKNLIQRIFEMHGEVALGASQLTRRQRQKYAANRFIEGKNIYYVFKRDYCPADIGVILMDLKAAEELDDSKPKHKVEGGVIFAHSAD